MTDRSEERARSAGAAVRERTAGLDADRGLDTVVRRGRRPRPAAALAVVLVLALAVPGVGWLRGLTDAGVDLESPADAPGPDLPPVVDETPAAPEPPTAPPTRPDRDTPGDEPGDGVEPVGEFGKDEVSEGDFPFGGGEYALLTDVRVAGHDGMDRVVLEFDGPDMPSWRVHYVEPPITQDGSGDEMHVEGEAFLSLELTPASGYDATDTEWEATYHGPNRVRGDTSVVTEVVRTGDFEAHLSWVVGLRAEQPFAVTVLSGPWRLVVDIQTP